ncbi:hypothetical protein [Pseudocolwellia agarivorans]|uniref:hypothetical protein n=1 Tax=Pseudocolwellia agarivorans TaxID=1911682 RepID=UPI003F883460
MKLENSQAYYARHSTSLSTVSRQLAFAGIAVIWIFVIKKDGQVTINDQLIFPLGCFVLGLTFDLLQYMYASAAWGYFNRQKELDPNITKDTDFKAPRIINWPTILFFWGKSVSIIIGYMIILWRMLH